MDILPDIDIRPTVPAGEPDAQPDDGGSADPPRLPPAQSRGKDCAHC